MTENTNHTRAILLVCAAVALFATMDTIARGLAQDMDSLQVVWGRYTFHALAALLLMGPRLRRLLRTRSYPMQILRSVLLFGATLIFFTALKFLTMAEATATFEVAPLLITVMAALFLGEQVGLRRWIGVIAGLVGALIIIQPGAEIFSLMSLLPLGAAACFAGYSVATRALDSQESPLTSLLYTALVGAVISCVIVPFIWTPISSTQFALMVATGLVGGFGQYLIILGFQSAPASVIAPFTYVGLLGNSLGGYLVYDEVPRNSTYLGAFVIVAAGLYVWHRETYAKPFAG